MSKTLPVGPLVSTVLAVAVANVLLAVLLVRAMGRDDPLGTGPAGLVVLALVGAGCGVLAVTGWRGYLRRRRGG